MKGLGSMAIAAEESHRKMTIMLCMIAALFEGGDNIALALAAVNRRAIRTTDRRPTLTRAGRLFEGSSALDFI
jgi:hypothetical protein